MTIALYIDKLATIDDTRFYGLVTAGAILHDQVLEQVVLAG